MFLLMTNFHCRIQLTSVPINTEATVKLQEFRIETNFKLEGRTEKKTTQKTEM